MFRLSVLLVFLAVSHTLIAAETIGQLLSRYTDAGRSQKYALAKELCDSFLSKDVYFTPPQAVSPTMPSDTLDALVYYGAVCYYFCSSDYHQLLAYSKLALPLLEHHHPLYYNSVLSNCAKAHYSLGDILQALETARAAERACRAINDYRELSRVYTTLSFLSTTQKQGQDAVDYVLKAIEANRQSGDTLLIHILFGAACEAYCTLGDYRRSIDYGWQSYRAARNRGSAPYIIASHLEQLGYTYYLADSLETSKRVLLDAVRIASESGSYCSEMVCQNLGFIYMKENNKAEAAKWFRKGLEQARLNGNRQDIYNLSRNLSDALRDSDPKESLLLLEQSVLLRDTIYNEELQTKLSEASASFHNEQLKQENENTRRVNRIILLSFVVGLLFAAAVIAMLLYAARTRKRVISTLRKLQVARDTFFTNVTHELRTPLTVIIGISHRLSESTGSNDGRRAPDIDDETAKGLTLIERNGQQLLTLVNQLLDIARASSNIGSLQWQRGNVITFVSMVLETARPLADANGVTLSYHPQSSEVLTDFMPDYVQKIVSNLLYNALKFTPAGGKVDVTILTEKKDWVVEVADTGCGITPDDLPHIFDPFFQGSNHTMPGTGVGLALVRQLTEALGGEVGVTSTAGKGTVFRVRMPLRHKAGTKALPEQPSAVTEMYDLPAKNDVPQPDDRPSEDTSTRILVVEDNPDVAYYIGRVLSDHYEVAYASNGRQGLERARQLMPDLIVTDIMMPDVDGLQLCRQVRADELTNHIPIIIITARATDDDRLTGIDAGADAYLYKPFRSDELVLRVKKLLEQRQMLQRKFSMQLGIVSEPQAPDTSPETLFERNVRQANEQFINRFEALVPRLMADGDCSTERVASELCMSRSQLARKLRAVIDMTPAAYILDIRLREVKRLLSVTPPLTLLDIALRCGFTDHAHLTNTFKRKYGVTPSQYMKENGSDTSSQPGKSQSPQQV